MTDAQPLTSPAARSATNSFTELPPMSHEHLAAVWEHSRQSRSHLIVLLAVATYSDHNGEWTADQATLERLTRLGNRRVRQLLAELVAEGVLAVASHHGRGKRSTYRLLLGKNRKPGAAPEAECQPDREKPEAEDRFPDPLGPPFPPDPQIPLYPPKTKTQETFGLRPLPGPQSDVFRVNLLLEEAAVPLPTPAQIGLWSKTLGGIEPLLDLLRRLIQAGLATKKSPAAYVHRVVMERANRPEPVRAHYTPRYTPRTRNPLLYAGSDEVRRQQAREITARQRAKRNQ
jgi:hypothetical protein